MVATGGDCRPGQRVWDLLTDVGRWPTWYHACRWVRWAGGRAAAGRSALRRSDGRPIQWSCGAPSWTAERPNRFAIDRRRCAGCTPIGRSRSTRRRMVAGTIVTSYETQSGCCRDWAGSSSDAASDRRTRRCWPISAAPRRLEERAHDLHQSHRRGRRHDGLTSCLADRLPRQHVTVYDAFPTALEKGQALHRQYADISARRGASRRRSDAPSSPPDVHGRPGGGGERCRSGGPVGA